MKSPTGGFVAYVAGQPKELAKIPSAHRAKPPAHDLRWVSPKELAEGTATGRVDDREIIAMGIGGGGEAAATQGIAFASVGGLTYHLAERQGLGREIPTDWFLQDIRN